MVFATGSGSSVLFVKGCDSNMAGGMHRLAAGNRGGWGILLNTALKSMLGSRRYWNGKSTSSEDEAKDRCVEEHFEWFFFPILKKKCRRLKGLSGLMVFFLSRLPCFYICPVAGFIF